MDIVEIATAAEQNQIFASIRKDHVKQDVTKEINDHEPEEVASFTFSDDIVKCIDGIIFIKIPYFVINSAFAWYKDNRNVIMLDFDEVTKKNKDLTIQLNGKEVVINELTVQVNDYKLQIDSLKSELENVNKRNVMLQNYLLAANADNIIPEDLYVEKVKHCDFDFIVVWFANFCFFFFSNGYKDEGRLYRGGVFLNNAQFWRNLSVIESFSII